MERNRVGESWLTGTVSSIGLSGCPDGRLVRLQSLPGVGFALHGLKGEIKYIAECKPGDSQAE